MESDFSAGAGVRKIIAGTNVTISPAGGTGNVTVNASGSGGGAVSSVANSDGTLVVSPTTGAVIASLNPLNPPAQLSAYPLVLGTDVPHDDVGDLAGSGFSNGQYAQWNGSKFVPASGGSGSNLGRPYDYEIVLAAGSYTATPISSRYSTTYSNASLATLFSADLMPAVSKGMAIFVDPSVNYAGTVVLSEPRVVLEGSVIPWNDNQGYIQNVEVTANNCKVGNIEAAQVNWNSTSENVNYLDVHDVNFYATSGNPGLTINNGANGAQYGWFDNLTMYGSGGAGQGLINFIGSHSSNGHYDFGTVYMLPTAGSNGVICQAGGYVGPPIRFKTLDFYDGFGGGAPIVQAAGTGDSQGMLSLAIDHFILESHVSAATIINLAASSYDMYFNLLIQDLGLTIGSGAPVTLIDNLNTNWRTGGTGAGVQIYMVRSQLGSYSSGTTGAGADFYWTIDHP